jgi:hypothetical protein
MNPTDVFTFANGILKKKESLTIPSTANAARAFQNRDGNGPAGCHSGRNKRLAEASVTAPTQR